MIDRFLTRISNAHSFLAKLWVLARPYWFTQDRSTIRILGLVLTVKEAWIGRGVLALSIFLSVLLVYLSKLVNAWYARFYNALQEKNAEVFWVELKYFAVVATLFIIAAVYRTWLTQLLTIRWRRWLSEVYFRDWLADRTYYHMELTRQGADNPEQRIEQDIFNFTKQTLTLTLELILQVMTLVTFAVVLWSLSADFVLPIFGGLAIPGFMMWAAIAYALVGSLATYFLGRPLVRVNFMLERYNADFRYRMTRIREHAESIALYRGERDEGRGLEGAFARVYETWWTNMKYTKRLSWLTYGYRQAAVVLPFLLAAPPYFIGQIAFGVLQQTIDAFAQLQTALSWFVDSYTQLAEWKAVVDRLTGFSESMVTAKQAAAKTEFVASSPPPGQLTLEDVEVRLPGGASLLEHVDLSHHPRRIGCAGGTLGQRQEHALPRARGALAVREGSPGVAQGRPRPVPAAEALPADRHAPGRAELSRGCPSAIATRRAGRSCKPARWAICCPASTRPPTGRWCCRAASSSAWPLRARCSTAPTGCSSTRRARRWTRPPSGACTLCWRSACPARR